MKRNRVAKYALPEARWAGVGPYYAMFPTAFADKVVSRFTSDGQTVIDPFAGRGTALFSAASSGRHALGIEINPVGWIYGATKLHPATFGRVEARVREIGALSKKFQRAAGNMPAFFRYCFRKNVLAFLLAARSNLDWRTSVIDRTLMTFLLIDLHGKRSLAFSNQMRQTKAMSPPYAIRWWQARGLRPPERDPVHFTIKKMVWRYSRGVPEVAPSHIYLGDCTHSIPAFRTWAREYSPRGAHLLFTSPPYIGVTNYHYDQWLRLWLLGGTPSPMSLHNQHRGKFENRAVYESMLEYAFENSKECLTDDATIYVRTDPRRETANITREVLKRVFPKHRFTRLLRPLTGTSQTRLFGGQEPKVGEVDFILRN